MHTHGMRQAATGVDGGSAHWWVHDARAARMLSCDGGHEAETMGSCGGDMVVVAARSVTFSHRHHGSRNPGRTAPPTDPRIRPRQRPASQFFSPRSPNHAARPHGLLHVTAIATHRAHESLRSAHLPQKYYLVLLQHRLLMQAQGANSRNILVVRLRVACHSRGGSSAAGRPPQVKKTRMDESAQPLYKSCARAYQHRPGRYTQPSATQSQAQPHNPVAAWVIGCCAHPAMKNALLVLNALTLCQQTDLCPQPHSPVAAWPVTSGAQPTVKMHNCHIDTS